MTPRPAAVKAALVAGGSGLVGGHLLQLLGDDTHYHRITSLVRRASASPRGVDAQVADFEQLEAFVPPLSCLANAETGAPSRQ